MIDENHGDANGDEETQETGHVVLVHPKEVALIEDFRLDVPEPMRPEYPLADDEEVPPRSSGVFEQNGLHVVLVKVVFVHGRCGQRAPVPPTSGDPGGGRSVCGPAPLVNVVV